MNTKTMKKTRIQLHAMTKTSTMKIEDKTNKKKIKIAEKNPFVRALPNHPLRGKWAAFSLLILNLLLVLKSIWADFFSVLLVFFQILP